MSSIIVEGLGTGFGAPRLLTQGFATCRYGTGGMAQGGSAVRSVGALAGSVGGLIAGGAAVLVGNVVFTPSGGTTTEGSSVVSERVSITGTGGACQGGGTASAVSLQSPTSGGSGMGGAAAASQAVAQLGGPLLTRGGSAIDEGPLLVVSPIILGLGTGRIVTQGYASRLPTAYVATASGGMGLGGAAGVSGVFQGSASGGLQQAGSSVTVSLFYHVYMNPGQGDPINYATPVATVIGQNWTSAVLSVPGAYKLGVRAVDALSGLEEQNVDAVVQVVLDAGGHDVTCVPLPPLGPRVLALAGGMVRVEWTYCGTDPARQPLGFRVYLGAGTAPSYASPVATVAWTDQKQGCCSADLTGLQDGVSYSIVVRAFNAVGEEQNTTILSIRADGVSPSTVDSFEVVATNLAT